MIDRYKRKLVLVSVTVIFVVIATIITGINVSNSIKISNNADITENRTIQMQEIEWNENEKSNRIRKKDKWY